MANKLQDASLVLGAKSSSSGEFRDVESDDYVQATSLEGVACDRQALIHESSFKHSTVCSDADKELSLSVRPSAAESLFQEGSMPPGSSTGEVQRLAEAQEIARVRGAAGNKEVCESTASENSPRWANFTVTAVLAIGATCLHAVPWLREDFTWCGWLGMAGSLFLVRQKPGGDSLLLWWCCGAAVLAGAFHWSPAAMAYTLSSGYSLGLVVATPLILWDGLRFALGYYLAGKITNDIRFLWMAAACTTILLENFMPSVFPWKLGHMQLSNPWWIQGVDIFGPSFSTFVAFAVAGFIQALIAFLVPWIVKQASAGGPPGHKRLQPDVDFARPHWQGNWALLGMLLLMGYNQWACSHWTDVLRQSKSLRVGLVQVDPSYVESNQRARRLSNQISGSVDLICWPESSAGCYNMDLDSLANEKRVFQLSRDPARGLRPWPAPSCELLVAGRSYLGEAVAPKALYVTAMLLDPHESIRQRHHKRFLMPFGEYVPGEAWVPGLKKLFDMQDRIDAGQTAQPLASETGARLGVLLCYEDMVPRAASEAAAQGANLIVSQANGSAFESPHTLYQHRLLAHLRALETRRSFLRCAATGETCVIDPLGRITGRLPLQTSGALVSTVKLLEPRSVYSRWPRLAPFLGWFALAACIAWNVKPWR